jgi:hypothetical protein
MTLPSHSDIKDVAEAKDSSSSNTWSIAPQTDDAEHLLGRNGSQERGASIDVCDKGTQTDIIEDEVTSHLVSSSAQGNSLNHSAVVESELVSRLDGSSTKAENGSVTLGEQESAEMKQLKMEIHHLKESDIPELCQQLQDVKRDLDKWKERALVAENKAKLFQKFTTRVKRLHGSLSSEGSRQSGDVGFAVKEESDAEGSYLIHSVRFKNALEAIERGTQATGDQESTDMGDGDVIAAKIFQSLCPRMHTRDGSPSSESPSGGSETTAMDDGLPLHGMDGVASPRDDEELLKLRLGMVELWMVVQELLRVEEEEASSSSSSPSSSSSSSQQLSPLTGDENFLEDAFL